MYAKLHRSSCQAYLLTCECVADGRVFLNVGIVRYHRISTESNSKMNKLFSPSVSPEAVANAWRQERPDLDHDGLSLLLRVRSLAMLIDQHVADIAEQLEIDYKELMLLFALRRSGEPYCMRPTDVFRLLKVTSGAATYRADKMVEKGLVLRVPDPMDRRSQLIKLSRTGMRLADDAVGQLAVAGREAIDPFQGDQEALGQLGSLLSLLEAGWLSITPENKNPLARRGD